MQTEIVLGLQIALRFGRMKDEDIASVDGTSLIKRNNCGKALNIACEMMDGNGISDEFGVARYLVILKL